MNYTFAACACAALIYIAPAYAEAPLSSESSVTLYGSIDQGVQYLSHAATGKTTGDAFQVGSGMATSFFGLRGAENLGGGLMAIWNLEGGFSPQNGTSSQGGRLFGRQSYVGLDGPYGRLTFGRQYTMRFYAISAINPFGDGAQGLTTLDNGIANPRADNAISYRQHFGDFEAGVNYSFGRDAVSGNSAVATNCPGETTPYLECKEWSALLKYTGTRWGAAAAYERNYGGTSATYGGLTSPKLSDSRFVSGGYFNVDGARFGAGWILRVNEGVSPPRSNLFWVDGTVPVGPAFSIDGMVADLKFEHSQNKALVEVLRGVYSLSKSTSLYLTGEHIQNGGKLAYAASTMLPVEDPPVGGSQISVIAGIKHRF
ncbi:porin [Paraburkholderia phosphatilytica]|uniref:porin n=1 Tax=Paraburkholderia phosphatilytica TaxID=2282883 RepID=UPI000E47B193|nr:porin [Paraburkholderia phosphatilytica]